VVDLELLQGHEHGKISAADLAGHVVLGVAEGQLRIFQVSRGGGLAELELPAGDDLLRQGHALVARRPAGADVKGP
jgi:hypothetical protein